MVDLSKVNAGQPSKEQEPEAKIALPIQLHRANFGKCEGGGGCRTKDGIGRKDKREDVEDLPNSGIFSVGCMAATSQNKTVILQIKQSDMSMWTMRTLLRSSPEPTMPPCCPRFSYPGLQFGYDPLLL
jgi:hypothetical protein